VPVGEPINPMIPATIKPPRVHHAPTVDGIELPIIDITHPAFALEVSDNDQRVLIDRFMRTDQPLAKLPRFLRRWLLHLILRDSVLAQGLRRAEGTFLSGMGAYLFKLGPENLGAEAKPIDRRIAASLPALAMRLRVQDLARLLAEAVVPALQADARRPLHFINIAGGPASDSINALLLLQRDHPDLLAGRPIVVEVLDPDRAGPTFGARALAALQAEEAPLHPVPASFRAVSYNWTRPDELAPVLAAARAAHAVIAGSSEGGLFEYGTDEEIVANLTALRRGGGTGVIMAGSVTRADAPIQRLHQTSSVATIPRGLDVFRALARRAGWTVMRVIERPFSDHVLLAPAP
jgi:hypothetical protein